jgi:hypothetical protein
MLPDSQRGFAPTIRGMAHSNAKVTVSQHGYVIYETFVSPGAFAISDLYPTAQSGDLRYRLKRAMVRCGPLPNHTQPSRLCCAKGGEIQPERRALPFRPEPGRAPTFLQGTLFYGLPAEFTLYGGSPAGAGLSVLGAGRRARFWRAGVVGSDATWANTATLGKTLGGPFGARAVSKGFCLDGDLVQPRQLSLLLRQLLYASARLTPCKAERAWTTSVSAKRSLSRSVWRYEQPGDFRLVANVLAQQQQ